MDDIVMQSNLDTVFSIEVLFAGKCNLQCSYCLIHKNPEIMNEYEDNIRKSIINGSFQKNIMQKFEKTKHLIHHLSLWGAEPTLNADLAETFLVPIFSYFENIEQIMFSTNALIGFEKGIKPFIDTLYNFCKNNNRVITFDLQFSLDGPSYLTDLSRGRKGLTDIVTQAMKDTATYVHSLSDKNFIMHINAKPTVSPDGWEYLLNNNLVYDWFKFFDDLTIELVNLAEEDSNIYFNTIQEPTLCTPYDYTKKDGILYANFLKAIHDLDVSKLRYHKHPLVRRYDALWEDWIGMLDWPGIATSCSAGYTSVSIDYEGNIMTCHRLYDSVRSGGAYFPSVSKTNSFSTNQKELTKISYTSRVYFISHQLKMDFIDACLIAMVSSGEIDKKYLDIRYRRLLYILMGVSACYVGECGLQTSSLYIHPFSKIRLYCNGALEEIIKQYEG